ncbi:hypothetical protein FA13DRAFT_1414048 [Coprinellus micaceus]|uniref:Uncharacterized protein n=1 Tax=Coprinellus micaceus TaxID=71717 RepID=A0A4Y7SP61_COPMI|nr:hypothetical protein FA13DRAFT_1414048 [Coprinellus micaceus]
MNMSVDISKTATCTSCRFKEESPPELVFSIKTAPVPPRTLSASLSSSSRPYGIRSPFSTTGLPMALSPWYTAWETPLASDNTAIVSSVGKTTLSTVR